MMPSVSTASTVENFLLARGFKRFGRELRGNCPWRASSDSQSFVVTIDGDENGAWYDHRDNTGGSLYDLCERTGIEVARKAAAPAEQTKRAYRDLAAYAEAHGVPAAVYEAAGWTQTTRENRPALEYPTTSGKRFRFLDGHKPYFKHVGKNGRPYVTCWYGTKNFQRLMDGSGMPPVLCNGEPSVVAAQHWGIPAVCITSSGEKTLSPMLMDEFMRYYPEGDVIVAMDCDAKGRAASVAVTRQLRGHGYDAYAVDLGLTDAGDLADFCTLHRDGAAGRLPELVRLDIPVEDAPVASPAPVTLTPEEKQLVQITQLSDTLRILQGTVRRDILTRSPDALRTLLADGKALIEQLERGDGQDLMVTGEAVADMAAQQYVETKALNGAIPGLPSGFSKLDRLIDGLMPGINVFIGATGMGKSWMAASITGHLVKNGYNGTVVSTEMLPKVWMRRVAAYISGLDSLAIKRAQLNPQEEARYIDALNYLDQHLAFVKGVRPTAASLRATVLNAKMKGMADFIVVDSASRLVEQGDNIAGETANIQNFLQELALETELPFIVTGQVKGREIANRAMKMPTIGDSFGGSAWEFNCDIMVGLYNHSYYVKNYNVDPDPNFPDGTFAMRVLKNREGESVADKILKMQFVGGRGLFEVDESMTAPEFYTSSRYKGAADE